MSSRHCLNSRAEELAELRTLQQIVDYMRDHSGEVNGASSPEPVGTPSMVSETAPDEPVGAQHAVPLPPAPVSTPGISVEALSAALLEIVSEKTGYPTEMLELEMDIEADLGIDSIKRVEILGRDARRVPGAAPTQSGGTGRTTHPATDCRLHARSFRRGQRRDTRTRRDEACLVRT